MWPIAVETYLGCMGVLVTVKINVGIFCRVGKFLLSVQQYNRESYSILIKYSQNDNFRKYLVGVNSGICLTVTVYFMFCVLSVFIDCVNWYKDNLILTLQMYGLHLK